MATLAEIRAKLQAAQAGDGQPGDRGADRRLLDRHDRGRWPHADGPARIRFSGILPNECSLPRFFSIFR